MCLKEECFLVETGYWINTQSNRYFRRNRYITADGIDQFVTDHNHYGLFTTPYQYNSLNIEDSYLFSDLYLDFDDKNDFETVRADAIKSISYMDVCYHIKPEQLKIYFSGNKGIHIMIPALILGIQPHKQLNNIYKFIASDIMKHTTHKTLDLVIYDSKRLFRIPGTIHEKTGLYKIPIEYRELRELKHTQILYLAKKARQIEFIEPQYSDFAHRQYTMAINDYIKSIQVKVNIKGTGNLKYTPPCIMALIEKGATEGNRNNTIAVLASFYRNCGSDYIETMKKITEWNNTKNTPPTKQQELERSVRSIYSGKASYGCSTLKAISDCDECNCRLMKNRKVGVVVK